ncbi:UNVERIFIED_CONTAM: hypothetical protein HDU68_011501 [Siphonaria sp. JEL0065]|nr:hypothetical protein HDU68_011501 [Siphonaria sp. JEL0065]
MIAFRLISAFLLITSTWAAPNDPVCSGDNWDRGDEVDPLAPPGPYPVAGQQVYIKDTLKQLYYSKGLKPTVVQAEGYVRSFCVGQSTPGSLPMPAGAITSAHVIKNYTKEGSFFMQITGHMNCDILNINCQGDNGGQYDSVPYRNCGKEPYSGVNTGLNPTFENYVEQAGDGIFCMRTCQVKQLTKYHVSKGQGDPCNVKNDTAGCEATMGFNSKPGFTFLDVVSGTLTELPAPTTTTTTTKTATASSTETAGTSEKNPAIMTAAVQTTSKSSGFQAAGYISLVLALSMFALL